MIGIAIFLFYYLIPKKFQEKFIIDHLVGAVEHEHLTPKWGVTEKVWEALV